MFSMHEMIQAQEKINSALITLNETGKDKFGNQVLEMINGFAVINPDSGKNIYVGVNPMFFHQRDIWGGCKYEIFSLTSSPNDEHGFKLNERLNQGNCLDEILDAVEDYSNQQSSSNSHNI